MRTRSPLLIALVALLIPAATADAARPAQGLRVNRAAEPDGAARARAAAGAGEPALACLPAQGAVAAQSVRGVRVGARARIRDAAGNPVSVAALRYCVEGGGEFKLALTRDSDIVIALSTADGDSIGPINPSSPAMSARMQFPRMKKLVRTETTSVFRVDRRRQLILGVAAGRVSFVAAADRLLLEYPSKLAYYVHRLGY